ncbi:heterogeneous nuclear ribonucleoprotein H [Euwallacea similis]|uniref:heterogeneous nuclear ribonucleoprotein H n=1 Tax=Euwallacea similis TaxID=1736056 RepID=UPI00344EF038
MSEEIPYGIKEELDYIVKLRGLPWSATEDDVAKFLGGEGIREVHLTLSKEGRPSGEAFVELDSMTDLERVETRDKEHMGSRYIEVFKVKRAEMDWIVNRSGAACGNDDGCVRLRGLPFECSKEEIAQFFTGLEIVPNGITLLTDYAGRSSGEAYVQFANRAVAERALEKHREKIGHRYIEIFRSSLSELNEALGYAPRNGPPARGPATTFGNRPGPYDRGDRFGGPGGGRFLPRGNRNFKGANLGDNYWVSQNRGQARGTAPPVRNTPDNTWNSTSGVQNHCIHMRGLPFRASQQDISEFFSPVQPASIHILTDHIGRPSGTADVSFSTHEDALKAMSKDKSHMSHRYIELFLNSSEAQAPIGTPARFRR